MHASYVILLLLLSPIKWIYTNQLKCLQVHVNVDLELR